MFLLTPFCFAECYCENTNGEPGRNGIVCRLHGENKISGHCSADQWCTGPSNIENATRKEDLCSKGKAIKTEKASLNSTHCKFYYIGYDTLPQYYFTVIVSCGTHKLYPNCTYCPRGDKEKSMDGCQGNCKNNFSTGKCEVKGESDSMA